ncbi:MAG: hypothetical protein ACOC87_04020 [Candidatus Natronoplasma sp.]
MVANVDCERKALVLWGRLRDVGMFWVGVANILRKALKVKCERSFGRFEEC